MSLPAAKKDLDMIDRFMERNNQEYKKKDLDFLDDFLRKKGFPQK